MSTVDRAYVMAAMLSILFFVIGVVTGLYVTEYSSENTAQQVNNLKARVENAQLEYIYLSTMGDKISCSSLSQLIESDTNELGAIGGELVALDRKGEKASGFYDLKRDYTLLSVRAWILNSYMSKKCLTYENSIMYFYSIPCNDCIRQGYILDDIRSNDIKDLRVFVLDYGYNESIITTLRRVYNVTQTPSLVIGNRTYTGFQDRDALIRILRNNTCSNC